MTNISFSFTFCLVTTHELPSIGILISSDMPRGVVRGVAGVARATPIFQVLFHKTLSPKALKPTSPQTLKPTSPQTLKPQSPQTHKPLSPKPSNPEDLKLSTPQTIKPSNP